MAYDNDNEPHLLLRRVFAIGNKPSCNQKVCRCYSGETGTINTCACEIAKETTAHMLQFNKCLFQNIICSLYTIMVSIKITLISSVITQAHVVSPVQNFHFFLSALLQIYLVRRRLRHFHVVHGLSSSLREG